MDRRSIMFSMQRKNSVFSLYIQGLWGDVMRLAKRVALVPQRRTFFIPSASTYWAFSQARCFTGGTKINGMCFLPTKSSRSSSCKKAVHRMLKRMDYGVSLIGFKPWLWCLVALWTWAIYFTDLCLCCFFCHMEIIRVNVLHRVVVSIE